MTFSRTGFIFLLITVFVSPFFINNFIWLAGTEKIKGKAAFIGKEISGQIGHNYTVISFELGGDIFTFNTNDNIFLEPGTPVDIRYQQKNPRDARLNDFAGIWAGSFFYSGMPLLIILILAIHPSLIPYKSRIQVKRISPFLYLLPPNG